MNHHFADSSGDAYPASEPQAANDARPKVQPLAPRPDYSATEPSSEPSRYNWVLIGKDQVLIHPTADHQLMLEMGGHSHFSRPHAKGVLHLFDRWDAEFELVSSNVALGVVEKALKKAAKTYGWNFKSLIDEDGLPHMEKTGADFGVGPNNPGVKDWRNKDWAGTDQFDQMPPPGWDDAPDESELKSGPYSCQDCDQTFANYGQWREHVVAEHTKAEPLPSDVDPYVNMDATFPNNFMEYQRKQDQLGVVAGWTLAKETPTQRNRRYKEIGDINSEHLHTTPDGWTVHRLNDEDAVKREGRIERADRSQPAIFSVLGPRNKKIEYDSPAYHALMHYAHSTGKAGNINDTFLAPAGHPDVEWKPGDVVEGPSFSHKDEAGQSVFVPQRRVVGQEPVGVRHKGDKRWNEFYTWKDGQFSLKSPDAWSKVGESEPPPMAGWVTAAVGGDTPVRLYHVTDDNRFELDPSREPADNTFAIEDRSGRKGIYLTDNPDSWRVRGYHRPYVAEIQVPEGVAQQERWGSEFFLPAEHFDKAQVMRVMPFDVHQQEKWNDPNGGTVTNYHGRPPSTPADKDVRDFTAEEHVEHLQRLRDYLHDALGWGWNEFDEQGRHVGTDEVDSEGMPIRRDRNGEIMTRGRYAAVREVGWVTSAALGDDMDMADLDAWINSPAFRLDQPAEPYNHEAEIRGWSTQPEKLMSTYAEMVPVEHIDRAREFDRAPGEKDFDGDPQKWDALKSHMKEHGITSPIIMHYNPDTGESYVAEGNHRVQVAKELGMTHVPVVMYRHRRGVGYGGRHIKVKPIGGQLNEYGYEKHVPQYIRPSDVGLPVREVNPKEASQCFRA